MVRKFYSAPSTAAPPEAKESTGGHFKAGELIPDMEGTD